MKIFQKIIFIIIPFIALAVLTIVFILPIFQKKSLSLDFFKQIIIPTPSLLNTNPISTNSADLLIHPTIIVESAQPTVFDHQNLDIQDTTPWGVAQQVGEHTWTMRIGEDSTMATAVEIFDALNNYRANHGSQKLSLDQKLSEYAQSRAGFFAKNKNLDSHQGFNNFLENEDGFNKLGFTSLGENASFGYQLNGVHIIEWIFAGDEAHDQNQLNNQWNYVGIGVKNTAVCIIFGTGKM